MNSFPSMRVSSCLLAGQGPLRPDGMLPMHPVLSVIAEVVVGPVSVSVDAVVVPLGRDDVANRQVHDARRPNVDVLHAAEKLRLRGVKIWRAILATIHLERYD